MYFRNLKWSALGVIVQSVFLVCAIPLGIIPFFNQSLFAYPILLGFAALVVGLRKGDRSRILCVYLDGMAIQAFFQGLAYGGIVQFPSVVFLIPSFLNEGPIAIAGIAGHAALQLELGVIALLFLALIYGSITVLATLWRKVRPATQ